MNLNDAIEVALKTMPVSKQIIVLANSMKHDPGRCIAGREIVEENAESRIGSWVRPVSQIGEGELYPRHFSYGNGSFPEVFDVVQFKVESSVEDVTQPENWLISEDQPWKKITKWPLKRIFELLENPPAIWLQPDLKVDRMTKEYAAANPPSQSLYFLELDNAVAYINDWEKFRLCFHYKSIEYDFSITDPLITEVLGDKRSAILNKGLVCVSLAPIFRNPNDGKDYHFKVAATVISYE